MRAPLFEYTDFHQTNTHLYIFGYTAIDQRGKLLAVSRTSATPLVVHEDDREYTLEEYQKELKRLQEVNAGNGGLQPVCKAYGILGCFRLLAGYYFLVLTERQYVGCICGHGLYDINDVQLIPLLQGGPKATAGCDMAAERRYRRLLTSGLDLSKDFSVSYSYSLCHTLQTNLTQPPSDAFESRFVWNEYLTQDFRELVKPQWVVPIIHGYLEQKVLSVFGVSVVVTLISRRSRFFAGTRYLKRGINGRGHVANDVETEQIVQTGKDPRTGRPLLSSFVQMRGSVPLYWSQAPGPLSVKPEIQLQHFDPLYEATNLHFEDLSTRYSNPVVVLNLVKRKERTPHEGVLGEEFKRAVALLNGQRAAGKAIDYIAWDFTQVSKRKGLDYLLPELRPILEHAFNATGVFVYNPLGRLQPDAPAAAAAAAAAHVRVQRGLLRTNCIDCLDRTNVVQCIFGLLLLGAQLRELDLSDTADVDHDSSMAMEVMDMYERMGDVLAFQYGGSEAHNKFFQAQRGNWQATMQSRDLMTSIKRFYHNTITDAEKQHAMNLFLGNFVPEPGKPALWDLESDIYLHAGPGLSSPMYAMESAAALHREASAASSATTPHHSPSPSPRDPGTPTRGGGSASFDRAAGGALASAAALAAAAAGADHAALAEAVTAQLDAMLGSHAASDGPALHDPEDTTDPLKEVEKPHSLWTLPTMPMFGGAAAADAAAAQDLPKMASFDALMRAPQGNPVAVRSQRDTAARVQQTPLVGLFRSALGFSSKMKSPRGAAEPHLDGRSYDLSRDLSVARAAGDMSRTQSFLSNDALSEAPPSPSPAAGVATPQAPLFAGAPGGGEEAAARAGLCGRAAGVPPVPRSRIAGLPMFTQQVEAGRALPSTAVLETMPSEAGSELLDAKSLSALPPSPAGFARGASPTSPGALQATPDAGAHSPGAANSPQFSFARRMPQRSGGSTTASATGGGAAASRHSQRQTSFTRPAPSRSLRSERTSAPGHSSHIWQLGELGPSREATGDLATTADLTGEPMSAQLDDLTTSAGLSEVLGGEGGRWGGGFAAAHARVEDLLPHWVSQDVALGAAGDGGGGTPHGSAHGGAHASTASLRSCAPRGAPARTLSGGGRRAAAVGDVAELSRYSIGGVSSMMQHMAATEAEYGKWLAQFPAAFLDPLYEEWLVAAHAERLQAHLGVEALFEAPERCR